MRNMKHVRSVVPMRTAKTGYIAIAVLFCLTGGFLLAKPDTSAAIIGTVSGWSLMLFGVFKLIGYFSKDLYRLAFQYDLISGLMLLILGAVILTKPENLLHFLCIACGLFVTADGLLKLQTAHDSKVFGIERWWLIMAAALMTCALGVLLLFRSSAGVLLLMRLFGTVLLAEGLLNLITVLMTVKIIGYQMPDVIDAHYIEGEN